VTCMLISNQGQTVEGKALLLILSDLICKAQDAAHAIDQICDL